MKLSSEKVKIARAAKQMSVAQLAKEGKNECYS